MIVKSAEPKINGGSGLSTRVAVGITTRHFSYSWRCGGLPAEERASRRGGTGLAEPPVDADLVEVRRRAREPRRRAGGPGQAAPLNVGHQVRRLVFRAPLSPATIVALPLLPARSGRSLTGLSSLPTAAAMCILRRYGGAVWLLGCRHHRLPRLPVTEPTILTVADVEKPVANLRNGAGPRGRARSGAQPAPANPSLALLVELLADGVRRTADRRSPRPASPTRRSPSLPAGRRREPHRGGWEVQLRPDQEPPGPGGSPAARSACGTQQAPGREGRRHARRAGVHRTHGRAAAPHQRSPQLRRRLPSRRLDGRDACTRCVPAAHRGCPRPTVCWRLRAAADTAGRA